MYSPQRRLAGDGSTRACSQERGWGVATDVTSALRIPRRQWLPEYRVPKRQLRFSTARFLGSAVTEARSGANQVLVSNLTSLLC